MSSLDHSKQGMKCLQVEETSYYITGEDTLTHCRLKYPGQGGAGAAGGAGRQRQPGGGGDLPGPGVALAAVG